MSMLSLLDVTKRNGTDLAVGLVEEVTTFAPEINTIMGRSIPGTAYKSRVRSALPSGPVFRKANAGVTPVKSTYDQKLQQCFIMDAQIVVDEVVADAPEEGGREMLLADEAIGVMKQKSIALGTQVWYGTTSPGDSAGFAGLVDSYDSTNLLVKAGGTSSTVQSSCWLVWNHLQGVHFIFGNNSGLQMGQWFKQQITDPNDATKRLMAWVNNVSGWIGLSFNHTKSAVRIANCEDATNKNLSDAVMSKALALLPLVISQDTANLRWFMNRSARSQLQRSRSVTIFSGMGGKASSSMEATAPIPTEAFGIPIVCTDSLIATEAVVS